MVTLNHARNRLSAVLAEVERLKESEFPYSHPREALDLLQRLFKKRQTALEKVSPSTSAAVLNNACSTSLYQLFVYTPILGFILRATNVRNAFECYPPLLRLARIALKSNDVKLVISSEWDYSPFVYRAITDLPEFILIGLPAPESSNPLVIPLAGHELGHSLWEAEKLGHKLESKIENSILTELTTTRWAEYNSLYPQYKKEDLLSGDIFSRPTWISAFTWCSLQAEEMFCDFFGLRLFAESYLHAFAYLLAPGTSERRSLHYPNIQRRITCMINAANSMGIAVPSGFMTCFEAETEPDEPASKLLVSIADNVSQSLMQELIQTAKEMADARNVPCRDHAQVAKILSDFTRVIPTGDIQPLTNIINAGWQGALNPNLWDGVPQIGLENRDQILRDLVLKSMEVSEVLSRLGEP